MRPVLRRLFRSFPRLQAVFLDGGYRGRLIDWGRQMLGWVLTVVKRTFAWLGGSRRLSKDYELRPENAETMVKIAMIHLMAKRLAGS